jgi:hypothetical protein
LGEEFFFLTIILYLMWLPNLSAVKESKHTRM